MRRFPQNSSYKFWMAVIHESLAGLLQERGQLSEARVLLQDSVALLKGLLQDDPRVGPVHGVLAQNYANLADVLRRLNEEKAAEEVLRKAQKLRPGP